MTIHSFKLALDYLGTFVRSCTRYIAELLFQPILKNVVQLWILCVYLFNTILTQRCICEDPSVGVVLVLVAELMILNEE